MPILRKQKVREYTTVDNYFVNDINVPVDCKGFLLFMLSKPDDWNFNFKNFKNSLNLGDKAIRGLINKLEELKYLKRERIRGEKGYYEWIYYVYEKPYDLTLEINNEPYSPQGYMDEGHIPNGKILLNTNINKDKEDKPLKKYTSSFFDPSEHNRLTLELINIGYVDKEDLQLFQYDDFFEDLLKENSYRQLIKVFNYVTSKVMGRDFIDEEGYEIKNKYGYLKSSMMSNINYFKNMPDDLYSDDDIDDYNWLDDDKEEDFEL